MKTLHDMDMDINGNSIMVAKDLVTSENRRLAMDNTWKKPLAGGHTRDVGMCFVVYTQHAEV